MIDGRQIRMARAALRWTIQELAFKADVGDRTIKRIEAVDQVEAANLNTIYRLKSALEAAGIEFIGAPNDAPGIRIHAQGGDRDKER